MSRWFALRPHCGVKSCEISNCCYYGNVEYKRCEKCKQSKPLTDEFWYLAKKGRWNNSCKECHGARCKKWRDNNKPRMKAYTDKWRGENMDLVRQTRKEYKKRLKETQPVDFIFEKSKSNARNHKHEHTITKTTVALLLLRQSERCYYSGLKFSYSATKNNPLYPSLDRIDSSKGYIEGNVVLVAWFMNRAKSDCTRDEFVGLIDQLRAVTPEALEEARREEHPLGPRPVASRAATAVRQDQPEEPEEGEAA